MAGRLTCQFLYLDLVQNLSDGAGEDQVCVFVVGGGGLVDEYQAVALVVVHQPGGGVDHQGGAPDDEHVRLLDVAQRPLEHPGAEALLVEDHVGLDDTAAAAPGHSLTVRNGGDGIVPSAGHAAVAQHAAMELPHPLTSGGLVQAVNVLGHDAAKLPRRLQLGQLLVGSVGLSV